MPSEIHTHTLPNGLRVIHETSSSPVVYCGYVVNAGTRHERDDESGMAHFIEHLSFKGTERRKAWQISNGLERVGGELNAFTGKQETVFCATVLAPHFPMAVDLLTDIVFHSTFPQSEINREVEVICDEIESYQDSPSEYIFDEFEEILFRGTDLGRDILGKADCLRAYTTADALRFTREHYQCPNAVFYVYGSIPFQRVIQRLQRNFPPDSGVKASPVLPVTHALQPSAWQTKSTLAPQDREIYKDRGTHQAHVVLGAPAYDGGHPLRYALQLLNNMLGGPGMNARLNTLLRERSGLVYTVESSYLAYTDVGVWTVYFGCDSQDIHRCVRMIRRELKRCTEELLTPRQLAAAKKQWIGQIGISRDAHENHAVSMGRAYARYGCHQDMDNLLQRIQHITAQDIQQAATDIFCPDRMLLLAYCPRKDNE